MVEKGDRWRSAKCVLSFAQLCWRRTAKSPSCQEPLFEKCTAEWRVSFLAAPHGACANLSNFLASQYLGRKSCLCRPWGIAKGTIQGWSFKKKQTCWLSTTSWQSVDTEFLLQLLDHLLCLQMSIVFCFLCCEQGRFALSQEDGSKKNGDPEA